MKRIEINVGNVAVVTKNKAFRKVLTVGSHWTGLGEEVRLFSMDGIYNCDTAFDLLMYNSDFSDKVETVNVLDNEIALKYVNGNFDSVLTPGRYFYWIGLVNFKFTKVDLTQIEINEDINISLYKNHYLVQYIREFKVESYEEALLIVDGKFVKKLTNGTYYFWKNIINIEVLKVDLRQLLMEVTGQEILTTDKAALRLSFVAQYRVVDIKKALLNSNNYAKQLYAIFQLALREYIGRLTLDELLAKKDSVSDFIKANIDDRTSALGVEIDFVGIRDVILPGEVKEIMSQVLVAQKQAQANIITRREETASTRSLLNTAKLMEDNAMLFKLKEMEYIEKIADRIGEITVSGNGQVIDQLTNIFSAKG